MSCSSTRIEGIIHLFVMATSFTLENPPGNARGAPTSLSECSVQSEAERPFDRALSGR
jgi:hypothetical protein